MALELKDRIYTTCTSTGTNNAIVGEAKEGYQNWEAITLGATVYYTITDNTAWEVGYGEYLDNAGTKQITRNLLSSNTGDLLDLSGNASIFLTYPSEKAVILNTDGNIQLPNANINAKKFVGDGSQLTNINAEVNNLAPEAPEDNLTYARNNKTWVSISDSAGIPDAPVDGVMYGRKDGDWNPVADAGDVYTKTETNDLLDEKADKATTYTKDATDTLLDSKANVGDSYTKAETYNTTEIDGKLFEKADKTDTYTKAEVDNSQDAQDTNISGNTSAIGTLSGRVSANEQDIATLQDGIFFSSSYTTDYPSNPNRDPETGNIYLQNLSAFTYSYADTNQVFISKTDEQGNVRQFTAVKPNDTLVLNQVESPNYGRYKVVSVSDVGDYVQVVVTFEVGEGTVLEGDIVALQAFPASEVSESIWTEEDGVAEYDGGVAGTEFYIEQFAGDRDNYIKKYADPDNTIEFASAFGGFKFLTDGTKETLTLARSGEVSTTKDSKNLTLDANVAELGAKARITTDTGTLELKAGTGGLPDVTISDAGMSTTQDMTVNGVTVGKGSGTGANNTALGRTALNLNETGENNVAVGYDSLGSVTSGSANIALGFTAGTTLTTGNNNIVIGGGAQPSAPDVSNEVTIGNDAVSKLRMGNGCVIGGEDSLKNTVLGIDAYQNNSVGMFSTAVGHSALKNSNYAYNTAIGYNAGSNLTDGGGNICIGYEAQASSPTVSNEVTIGGDGITSTRLKGQVTINDNLTINTGELLVPDMGTTGLSANVVIDASGKLLKSNETYYSAEEVDKKLAIKDKLIEKLSARLDELEKRVK